MARKKTLLNDDGFRLIRNTPQVQRMLLEKGRKLADAAGGEAMGYVVTELVLEDNRAAVSVMATGKAHFHNRKHHSLLRGLDAVRD